jgi:hypothetical protein
VGLRWDEDRGGVSVVCIAISMSTASGACQRGEPPRSPKAQRARSPAHSCALQSPGDAIVTGLEGGDVIRDRYIVNFRPAISKQTMEDVKDKLRVMHGLANLPAFSASVNFEFKKVVRGFSCMLSPFALKWLRTGTSGVIQEIEADMVVRTVGYQNNPPSWGLDRIDQVCLLSNLHSNLY